MTHVQLNAATISEIQKLFDALVAFMGDQWTTTNVSATIDPGGAFTNCSINCTDRANNSFTYSERIAGPRVSIAPPSVTLGPGQTHQFTATVTDPSGNPIVGAPVTWAVQGVGNIGSTGLYTAPTTIPASAQDTVTATYAPSGSSAAATVVLQQ